MPSSLRRIIAGTRREAGGAVGGEVADEILHRLDAASLAIVHKSDLEVLIDAARFHRRPVNGQLLTEEMDLALFLGLRLISSPGDKSSEKLAHLLLKGKPAASVRRTSLKAAGQARVRNV
jgi:hypothetical protein